MARWQPGATQRLVAAAVDLFAEQGYDATTVAQIAERAGVTRSTFFRHFSDKRELLVAGQETLSRLLADGITEAPANASPLEAVAAGLERASGAMGPANRELGPRIKAAVAASTELQERDTLKSVGLAAAMTAALVARGVPSRRRTSRAKWGSSRSSGATPGGQKATVTTAQGWRRTRSLPWTNCAPQPPRLADQAAAPVTTGWAAGWCLAERARTRAKATDVDISTAGNVCCPP